MDEFQKRYEDHQLRKSKTLEERSGDEFQKNYESFPYIKRIMENRRSQRIFNDELIADCEINEILNAIRISPSSCNRQAIYIKEVRPEDIEKYLVGGKNWINKANRTFLLFADKIAYKSPNEKQFMPFLDAGFACQNVYLICEALNIGCCFVNPNIKEENKQSFMNEYGNDYFCGAIAIGRYDKKAIKPPLREIIKVKR